MQICHKISTSGGVEETDGGIINKCIIQGTFPNFLKKAIVSPAYKKKDSFDKENYRPISLLTTLSKVFEKATSFNFLHFLKKNFQNSYAHIENSFLPSTLFLDLLKTGKHHWKGTDIFALSLWICQKPLTVYQKTYF